ncbi:MAG: hypothetical protein Q4A01_07585 [Coriobacteriales bacterium]|nr:hypothetical protein [Coriobacteriales bacterium]
MNPMSRLTRVDMMGAAIPLMIRSLVCAGNSLQMMPATMPSSMAFTMGSLSSLLLAILDGDLTTRWFQPYV